MAFLRAVVVAVALTACGARTDEEVSPALGMDGSVQGPCSSDLPGPPLVAISGVRVCIDSTEVTNADYAAFLASSPAPGTGVCAFDTSHVPLFTWPAPPEHARDPVVNVNWCDARAYCTWAHKELCGRPDGSRGSLDGVATPSSAWYLACSNGNLRYPYGNSFDPKACNTLETHLDESRPVGSFVNCHGGQAGLFDMSGNVWEWEDACEARDAGIVCAVRGGGFRNDQFNVTCAGAYAAPIATTYDYYGIRCCAL